LDTRALPADLRLIGYGFGLAAYLFNGATFKERGQGFISIGIGIAIIPKAMMNGMSLIKN